jgi:uncharacterized membrane protein (UPF0182 family)
VRSPQDLPRRTPRRRRHRRVWLVVAVVVAIVVIASLRSIATFYTDYLWFGSVHLAPVWRRLLEVKLGLFFFFAAVFFLAMWVSLAVVDRVAPSELTLGPEDELVRRYRLRIAPRAVLVRSLVALAVALLAASGTVGQWQNFLLFTNAQPFAQIDPQFHKNVGFFVFALPFLSFLVGWTFVALVVITVISMVAHYLNGGIRIRQGVPSVSPAVKAHLSVLLALMALVKVFGYVLARYDLDLASIPLGSSSIHGAGYTAVHTRMPAYTLLIWVSVLAAAILIANIWRRGWALPAVAVGLWALLAVVIGAIYPAIVQALKVNPSQAVRERPYISRNIAATRDAMDLNGIKVEPFAASQSLTPAQLAGDDSVADVRLWDPTQTNATYQKLQDIRSYYEFQTLAIDRYDVNGVETPVVVGVRQINTNNLPAQGWVNTHLEYTHGYGFMASPANQVNPSGQPVFAIADVPPSSSQGLPAVTQPDVYYGLNYDGTAPSYVIADTKQPEIDYQITSGPDQGANVETRYAGTGGVKLSSFGRRLAFALRFGDLNMLISNLITPQSRVLFYTNIQDAISKAAPFLSLDSDPYPVLAGGQIYWVQDAYTTTANYPYAQTADTTALAPSSGLQQNFDYVRNSVKVVVDAYNGKMTFYDMTAPGHEDPILRTWEKAFPGMFTPASEMPAGIRAHLRYPEDLLTVQAAALGRYHITNPAAFYNATDAWHISQYPGAGSPSQALATTVTTNAQGLIIGTGQIQRMAPIYQVLQVPGQSRVSFNLMDAFVPVSSNDQLQTLSAFIVAGCDPGDYGKLTLFVTPRGEAFDGPALVDARIQANTTVSQEVSLLNQNGSQVLLGNVLMVPVGQSILYFRPLYVQSARNPLPVLEKVIAVYGGSNGSVVGMGDDLAGALQAVFQASIPVGTTTPTPNPVSSGVSLEMRSLIQQAAALAQQIQNDLKAGNLGQYQTDVNALAGLIAQLEQLSSGQGSGTSGAGTSGSSPPPSGGSGGAGASGGAGGAGAPASSAGASGEALTRP